MPTLGAGARSARGAATAVAAGLQQLLHHRTILARRRKQPTSTAATRARLRQRPRAATVLEAVLCVGRAFRPRRPRQGPQLESRNGGGWRRQPLHMLGRTRPRVGGAPRAPGPAGAAAAEKKKMTTPSAARRRTTSLLAEEVEVGCTRANGAITQAADMVRLLNVFIFFY